MAGGAPMSPPTFERLRGGRQAVSAVSVGPFRLIARSDSYTLGSDVAYKPPPVRDLPANSERDARQMVINAARAQLAVWGAELDELAQQERG